MAKPKVIIKHTNYKAEKQNFRKRIESRGIKNLSGFQGFSYDCRSYDQL